MEFCKHHQATNTWNLAYIQQVYMLKGFSGIVGPGHHVNAADHMHIGLPDPLGEIEAQYVLQELSEDIGFHENDGTAGEVSAIIDYLVGLAT